MGLLQYIHAINTCPSPIDLNKTSVIFKMFTPNAPSLDPASVGCPKDHWRSWSDKHATDLTICIPKTTRVSPRSFGLADVFSCEEKKWQFCSSNVCSSIFSLNLAKNAHIHQHRPHFISKNKSQAVKPLNPNLFPVKPKKKHPVPVFFSPWMEVRDPPALFKGIQQTAGWIIWPLSTEGDMIDLPFRHIPCSNIHLPCRGTVRPGVLLYPPCLDVPGR